MEPSEQASTSSVTLPSRKAYITVLSTVAFVSGVGIATVVTIRRGRRMRLEELQNATQNLKFHVQPARDDTSLGLASAQGPFTLFRELNRAVFGKKSNSSQQVKQNSPSVLTRQRGKQVKASVFDSSSASAAPSALMKATTKSSEKKKEAVSIARKPQSFQVNPVDEDKSAEGGSETLLESPVMLAVKAIGIATALVGTGALVGWEVARRLLGVQNIDELIDRLATVVPSRAKDNDGLSHIGEAARNSLRSKSVENETDEEMLSQSVSHPGKPLPLDEALAALEQAASKGEASTWVSLLSRQLDAEREQDLEERRQRIARQRNAVQEQMVV